MTSGSVDKLFDGNVAWRARIDETDPDFFPRLAQQQAPHYFWIGCSDSRVPANMVAGLDPGEVFVHRNVANVVHSSDLSLLSALEYAVEVLKVSHVIVCGHYGCGGVEAATRDDHSHGLANHWLEPIRRLVKDNHDALGRLAEAEERRDRLAELNVLQGVRRVAQTPIIRRTWALGGQVQIHGLMYGLKDGRLRDLGCTISGEQGAS
ncbi:MAG: carbonic anhydrase [Neomegalonema sp.]|nr:carbonic anhydrase [Neomegalonema sp.]